MEKVSIIDIQGVQWAIKDQEASNSIAKINTTLESQQTRIEQLNKNLYLSNAINEINSSSNMYWVKVNGLYTNGFYETSVFALSSRNGEYHELFCGNTDSYKPVAPLWLSYFRETGKIDRIKYKNGSIWIQLLGYSALRIQQLNGSVATISLSKENPPNDAEEIFRKQITMS